MSDNKAKPLSEYLRDSLTEENWECVIKQVDELEQLVARYGDALRMITNPTKELLDYEKVSKRRTPALALIRCKSSGYLQDVARNALSIEKRKA